MVVASFATLAIGLPGAGLAAAEPELAPEPPAASASVGSTNNLVPIVAVSVGVGGMIVGLLRRRRPASQPGNERIGS